MSKVFLKVKIKSLAAEAKIIRQEENKIPKPRGESKLFLSLRFHRIIDVRDEARYSLLAYAFIRGKLYSKTEHENSRDFDYAYVLKLVHKFGGNLYKTSTKVEHIEAWHKGLLQKLATAA